MESRKISQATKLKYAKLEPKVKRLAVLLKDPGNTRYKTSLSTFIDHMERLETGRNVTSTVNVQGRNFVERKGSSRMRSLKKTKKRSTMKRV